MSRLITPVYVFLQVLAIGLCVWSFKLDESMFVADKGGDGFIGHQEQGGILGAGVCTFGKIGAWCIIGWIIISMIILNLETNAKVTLCLLFTQAFLIAACVILTVIMNLPLFIRTIPFVVLEVCLLLYILGTI